MCQKYRSEDQAETDSLPPEQTNYLETLTLQPQGRTSSYLQVANMQN